MKNCFNKNTTQLHQNQERCTFFLLSEKRFKPSFRTELAKICCVNLFSQCLWLGATPSLFQLPPNFSFFPPPLGGSTRLLPTLARIYPYSVFHQGSLLSLSTNFNPFLLIDLVGTVHCTVYCTVYCVLDLKSFFI